MVNISELNIMLFSLNIDGLDLSTNKYSLLQLFQTFQKRGVDKYVSQRLMFLGKNNHII